MRTNTGGGWGDWVGFISSSGMSGTPSLVKGIHGDMCLKNVTFQTTLTHFIQSTLNIHNKCQFYLILPIYYNPKQGYIEAATILL